MPKGPKASQPKAQALCTRLCKNRDNFEQRICRAAQRRCPQAQQRAQETLHRQKRRILDHGSGDSEYSDSVFSTVSSYWYTKLLWIICLPRGRLDDGIIRDYPTACGFAGHRHHELRSSSYLQLSSYLQHPRHHGYAFRPVDDCTMVEAARSDV